MSYDVILEQRVVELKLKVKKANQTYFDAENLLPNFRTAEKCCCNCWFFDVGYEGSGECKILKAFEDDKDIEESDVFGHRYTANTDLCDYWESMNRD